MRQLTPKEQQQRGESAVLSLEALQQGGEREQVEQRVKEAGVHKRERIRAVYCKESAMRTRTPKDGRLTCSQAGLLRDQRAPSAHIPHGLQAGEVKEDDEEHDEAREQREAQKVCARAPDAELRDRWGHAGGSARGLGGPRELFVV